MMAAIVVPLAWRSIPSTVSCFEGKPLLACANRGWAAALDFDLWAVVFFGRAALGARLIPDGFAVCVVGFDFSLLVAIRPSLVSTTAPRAATATGPAIGQGNGRGEAKVRWRPQRHPHTLLSAQKSSEMSSNVAAFCAD